MYTLIAWNCRSSLAVVVEGDPGRTVAAVPAGTSSGTKRLGLEASTSLSGLASLCFRKLCIWTHTYTVTTTPKLQEARDNYIYCIGSTTVTIHLKKHNIENWGFALGVIRLNVVLTGPLNLETHHISLIMVYYWGGKKSKLLNAFNGKYVFEKTREKLLKAPSVWPWTCGSTGGRLA